MGNTPKAKGQSPFIRLSPKIRRKVLKLRQNKTDSYEVIIERLADNAIKSKGGAK